MPASSVNKDLQAERAKCSFDKNEFTLWWVGGGEKLKEKNDLGKFSVHEWWWFVLWFELYDLQNSYTKVVKEDAAFLIVKNAKIMMP